MTSHTTRRFREAFRGLPKDIQQQARAAYELFVENPYHSSLHFKPLEGHTNKYSVRIGRGYRALSTVIDTEVLWFWIGSHAEYDLILRRM